MFVAPTWIEGFLVQFALWVVVPAIIALGVGLIAWKSTRDGAAFPLFFGIALVVGMMIMAPVVSVFWFNAYEVPSVQEKIVTVKEWQPKPGIDTNEHGMMVIDNADELLMITTTGEGFLNEENFFFQKFNTRDILNTLKPNGTYKIKYYGWREGFNSGFPNILSVKEVINETNTRPINYSDYFGTKLA